MNTNQEQNMNLESVLLDFHVESEGRPSPEILEAYCRQYPQFARELTDYALEWLLDETAGSDKVSEVKVDASSPNVSRAISRLYTHIRSKEAAVPAGDVWSSAIRASNPFDTLSVTRIREIRDALGIDIPLFSKFRNRLIDPDTVPGAFLRRFAKEVKSTMEEFLGYLRLPPTTHAAANFKAEGKPSVSTQKERFEDAVRNASLDEKKKQALLKD